MSRPPDPQGAGAPEFDLVIALNYYAPYVSGLTDTAKVVAEGLAGDGWRVCVVTSRHEGQLPSRETLNGVDVIRTPVIARIGKGTVSPQLPVTAARVARSASVLNMHLPMLEAGLIARLVRSVPLVPTYHCDVALPPGRINGIQMRAVDRSSRYALRHAAMVVTTSNDYASTSRLWPTMQGRTAVIPPPTQDRRGGRPAFRRSAGLHVGFLGRIVEEKGLEYLVDGFLAAAQPDDCLLIGGDFSNVAGGSVIEHVRARCRGDERIRFLGFIADADLADFYASLDVFALPSVNSLEAFGIVQVEAMMTGVPVIASDLPGVRTPVRSTGFGIVVPPRDPVGIAAAMTRLRNAPMDRNHGSEVTRALFSAATTVKRYGDVFTEAQSTFTTR